jgi:hypothetical protein
VTSDEHINREPTSGSSDRFDETTLVGGPALSSGIVIGHYHLLHRIEVWLAEQKEPIRRRVAVKLIKAGMDSREVIRRFESERQTLALIGPSRHRESPGCGFHAAGIAVFRDGARRRRSYHRLLRQAPAEHA